MSERVIAVFGSSAPRRGEADFTLGVRLGRRLAEAGFAVATGGYEGTMTAVSEGANEAGGRVIGVTAVQMAALRGATLNAWVTEEVAYETMAERLNHLVRQNSGMVALAGGIGTLTEVMLAWNYMQVGEIEKRPLVLLGRQWKPTLTAFREPAYLSDAVWELVQFADDVETAVRLLK